MPYIPHTPDDVQAMLQAIGADSIEDLFDEIPAHLKAGHGLDALPEGRGEMEVTRLMAERAEQDRFALSFLGGGVLLALSTHFGQLISKLDEAISPRHQSRLQRAARVIPYENSSTARKLTMT